MWRSLRGPRTIARGPAAISKTMPDDQADVGMLAIPFEPGGGALIRFGIELVIEPYERDPQATLARLADVATRADEPFQIPLELLVTE